MDAAGYQAREVNAINAKPNMKTKLTLLALTGALTSSAFSQEQPTTVESRIGKLEFTHDFANGYPTRATIEKLYEERDFQRACQAYLWALPAVSFNAWQRGQASLGIANGEIGAFLTYEDKLGILTATRLRPITSPLPISPQGR